MDPSQRLKELFDRYLRRDLQPAEVEELVQLLQRADAEETLSGPMLAVWEELKARPAEYAVDWERMYREVSQVEDELSMSMRRRRRGGLREYLWSWRTVAAVCLVLAATAAYWSLQLPFRRADNGMPVATAPAAGGVKGPAGAGGDRGVGHWVTAENMKVVHLPDGSMVILNRHSRLDYRAGADSADREAVLSGEGYFDIVHRQGRPFLVRTGKLVTRVLGTVFNVRAYAGDRSIEVTVEHGKVQVMKGDSSMGLLSDKEQIRYDKGTEGYSAKLVNMQPVLAWKPAEIRFDDITMEEAARRIGQRFNMGVAFTNPALKDCRVTATFYLEDDLDQIMTVICAVNQESFVIRGDKIVIDGKGCN